MAVDLERIEKLVGEASPGPWLQSLAYDEYGQTKIYAPEHEHVANTINGSGSIDRTLANAAFIASAREDVPALVAEIRRLREALGFYANENNFNDNGAPESGGAKAPVWSRHDGDFLQSELDCGKIARAALKDEAGERT